MPLTPDPVDTVSERLSVSCGSVKVHSNYTVALGGIEARVPTVAECINDCTLGQEIGWNKCVGV